MKIGANSHAYAAQATVTSPAQPPATTQKQAELESDTVTFSSQATALNNLEKTEKTEKTGLAIQGGHFSSRPPP